VPWAAITAGVRGNTLTSVEHLDRALGQPCLDLLADQGVRDGIEEPGDLDMIIDADPGQDPFGILMIGVGQRPHDRSLDGLEQFPPADPEAAHHPPVQLRQYLGDCCVTFGEREEITLRRRPRI
jgi:hypothetical protein